MSIVKPLVAGIVMTLFGGCSVFMAANTVEVPDESVLKIGMSKDVVETEYNNIVSDKKRQRGGSVATYQYFTEDDPSYGRAATYALLDVATLGLAEIATTPVEALQGNRHTVVVTYDRNNRVEKIEKQLIKAILPKPEKALGIED